MQEKLYEEQSTETKVDQSSNVIPIQSAKPSSKEEWSGSEEYDGKPD